MNSGHKKQLACVMEGPLLFDVQQMLQGSSISGLLGAVMSVTVANCVLGLYIPCQRVFHEVQACCFFNMTVM